VRFGLIARRDSSYSKTDVHGHGLGAHAAHGPEGGIPDGDSSSEKMEKDLEFAHDHKHLDLGAAGQIIGVFILEFGVLLHRCDLP
jgi:zinc transporter 1/2/3